MSPFEMAVKKLAELNKLREKELYAQFSWEGLVNESDFRQLKQIVEALEEKVRYLELQQVGGLNNLGYEKND